MLNLLLCIHYTNKYIKSYNVRIRAKFILVIPSTNNHSLCTSICFFFLFIYLFYFILFSFARFMLYFVHFNWPFSSPVSLFFNKYKINQQVFKILFEYFAFCFNVFNEFINFFVTHFVKFNKYKQSEFSFDSLEDDFN